MTEQTTRVPIDDLATVLDGVGDLLAAIRHEQWNASTPCPAWDVRQLVNHMALGNRLFSGIIRGEATVTPVALDPSAGDALGDDPVASYRSGAENLLAAFRQPGVTEQFFHVPVGAVPGIAAVHLRAVEDLVHGWDIARATGQSLRFPGALVERELEFTRFKLADVPPDQTPFASPQPVADHAPPLDRLAALLGRPISPPR